MYYFEGNYKIFFTFIVRGESKVLFVKNLSYNTKDTQLQKQFDGAVSARIAMDRNTGRSKG